MPLPSRFTPYGQLRYSSASSRLETIYRGAFGNLGGVYADDGPFEADMYAAAREVAAVDATLLRVKNHRDPTKVVDLLGSLEHEYGLAPPASATLTQRRAALADRVLLKFGARRDAVVEGLTAIVGEAGLVAYRTLDVSEVTPSPVDPYTLPGHNVYVPPGTPLKLWRTTAPVSLLGVQAVPIEYVSGDASQFAVGEQIVFSVGRLGCEETIVVTAATATTVTGDFDKAHDAGVYVRSGTWPRWESYKRLNIVVVSPDVFADAALVAKVHAFLRGALRGVSQWLVTIESSPGYIGPFYPGSGAPGVTSIPQLSI